MLGDLSADDFNFGGAAILIQGDAFPSPFATGLSQAAADKAVIANETVVTVEIDSLLLDLSQDNLGFDVA